MLGFWSPYLLAFAGAFLAVVSTLPNVVPLLGLRKSYQRITVLAWVLIGFVIALTVAYSSPWLTAGSALVVGAIAIMVAGKTRLSGKVEKEALSFLQALIGLMSSGDSLTQALRRAAQDRDFARLYPRLIAQTREIIAYTDTGKRLSQAIRLVAESLLPTVRHIWEQVAVLAELIEEESGALPVEGQRSTLQSMLSILLDVQSINQDMKTEMANMELAKWIFVLIIPGLNIYMAFSIDGYVTNFLGSLIGQVVLAIEVLALVAIFFVFSKLQKMPEVRI